jgi:hypothetical protein
MLTEDNMKRNTTATIVAAILTTLAVPNQMIPRAVKILLRARPQLALVQRPP